MRLKYYLRGLGIGIMAAAVLMGAAFGKGQELNDAQIRQRAAELGMVESSPAVLGDLETSRTDLETQEFLPERETAQMPLETEEAQAPSEAEAEQAPSETVQTQETDSVSVTIQSGDSSVKVSRMLAEAGLVQDAEAFDKYLRDNGFSKSLRIGTFQIEPGTAEEEIAEIITGK